MRTAFEHALGAVQHAAENMQEENHTYLVMLFRPGGKWKYNDLLVLHNDEDVFRIGFKEWVERAMRDTPERYRNTTLKELSDYVIVIPHTPLGFPIMVVGDE